MKIMKFATRKIAMFRISGGVGLDSRCEWEAAVLIDGYSHYFIVSPLSHAGVAIFTQRVAKLARSNAQ